MVLINKHTRNI